MSEIKPIDFSKLPQGLNTPTDVIIANVKKNIRRQLPQLAVYNENPREMCIVAGGPSLDDTWDEYLALKENGAATLAVNGAYKYLLERDIAPSLFAMLDAREWNKRFVDKTHPNTKHFLASQCHPAVFDALIGKEVYIWHAPIPAPNDEPDWNEGRKIYTRYYFNEKNYLIVPGGVTVTAKTVMMVYWLGFRKIHMFGFDSCWMGGKDHAYPQPENGDKNIKFKLGDRWFECAPWMAHQADSFFKLVVNLPENLELQVHGDGLIAYGLRRSAEEWQRAQTI